MYEAICPKCTEKHNLYYLIKSNATKVLFMLCPTMKAEEKIFTIFVSLVEGLPIPTYTSGTEAYTKLKNAVSSLGKFTPEEKILIEKWKKVRIVPSQMTQQQLQVIKQYVKGQIRW